MLRSWSQFLGQLEPVAARRSVARCFWDQMVAHSTRGFAPARGQSCDCYCRQQDLSRPCSPRPICPQSTQTWPGINHRGLKLTRKVSAFALPGTGALFLASVEAASTLAGLIPINAVGHTVFSRSDQACSNFCKRLIAKVRRFLAGENP